jgi:hypothetical protein
MGHVLKIVAKFGLLAVATTIACTILWEMLVNNRLYNCTDPGWLDYVSPGNWVHHPVTVHEVVTGRSMSEPDTIKDGWTVAGLWRLWLVFAVTSFVLSAGLALVPWIPSQRGKRV